MLPRPHEVVLIADLPWKLDGSRQAIAVAAQLTHHGPDARGIPAVQLRFAAGARRMRHSGEVKMDADPVGIGAVPDGSEQGALVRLAGEHGQVFADLSARDTCCDWLELPTRPIRGVRLGIKRLLLRRSAGEKQQDAGFRVAAAPGRGLG
jgi:hypothetical protein